MAAISCPRSNICPSAFTWRKVGLRIASMVSRSPDTMAVSHRASCARTSEQGGASIGNGKPAPVSAQTSARLVAGVAIVATVAGTAAMAITIANALSSVLMRCSSGGTGPEYMHGHLGFTAGLPRNAAGLARFAIDADRTHPARPRDRAVTAVDHPGGAGAAHTAAQADGMGLPGRVASVSHRADRDLRRGVQSAWRA